MKRQGDVLLAIGFLVLLAAAVLISGVPFGSKGVALPGKPSIVVPGEATVELVPDAALITASVTAEAGSFTAAEAAVEGRMRKATEVLRNYAAGGDITTGQTEIVAQQTGVVIGRTSLRVTIRSFDEAAIAADSLRALEGVEVHRIEAVIKNVDAKRQEAMDAAIADATRHATQAAQASGLRLGRVRSVTVTGGTGEPVSGIGPQLRLTVLVTFDAQ